MPCRLPERIRPNVLAFGGLADGYLPFKVGGNTHEIKLASIVMKAVQAQHSSITASTMPCSGKIGDDANAAKVQVRIAALPAFAACSTLSLIV